MSEDNLRLRFEIFEDGEVAETRELDRDVVKIGKLASSHLRLDRSNVSRIHAVIERSGDGSYSVIDLGSAEGTFVNGEQVTKSEVESGDELRFGDAKVRLEFVEVDQPQTSAGGGQAGAGAGVSDQRAAAAGGVSAEVAGEVSDDQRQTVTTEDGRQVEPYTLEGYYDDGGNYIPGYYDETGEYHLGYGYYGDDGEWRVAYGYYNPEGEWVSTDEPVESVTSGGSGARADWERTSDREEYTHAFFDDAGGETLEIAHLWGDHVLSVTSFEDGAEDVTIGPGEETNFQVGEETVAGDEAPFVVGAAGRYELVVTDQMRGSIRRGESEQSLRKIIESGEAEQFPGQTDAHAISLDRQTTARVELGGNTFLVHFTDMPAEVGGSLAFDVAPLPYQLLSAAAHLTFLFLCMSLPAAAGNLDLEKYSDNNRFVEAMVKPDQKKKKKPDWMKEEGSEEAAKHKGEETKAGKEDTEKKDNKMAIKGPPDNENTKLKKKVNKKIAMQAGIMKSFQQDQVASKWGSAEQSVGSDAIHALGNLKGDSKGTAKGFGGLGLKGSGRGGGGGMSESGLGIGNVGSGIGGGGGRGGEGMGKGKQDLGNKKDARPEVVPQRPAVEGALDKEIIRKVVRQHRREIKYCYEKELAKDPTLKGEVTVQFTISASGEVIAAIVQKSTLGNQAVETCMQGKIQRWTFPEPKGNGIVKVNYPFNFSSQE